MSVNIEDVSIIEVPIKPHYNGKYRLEYDSKYITLFGQDKRYEGFRFSDDNEVWYEEMVLIGCVEEVRNASPYILKVDDTTIYIKLVDDRV